MDARRLFGKRLGFAAFCLSLAIGALPAVGQDPITFRLEVVDALTGSALDVRIRRQVEPGTPALDAMRALIPVVAKTYPGAGEFVTGLCGVEAPKGAFWALYVDGEQSSRGISELQVGQPMHILWKLERAR